uniref:Uncharacterized protein n=1 Tax=Anopheles atroparvus TaxID=41427 RepID=A0AAG5DFI7_ANOAO
PHCEEPSSVAARIRVRAIVHPIAPESPNGLFGLTCCQLPDSIEVQLHVIKHTYNISLS